MKIAVFGATGVLGRRLLTLLADRGHHVFGTTRHRERLQDIHSMGATALLCDGLSPASIEAVLRSSEPEVAVHLMTDLPSSWAKLRNGTPATNRLRRRSSQNLSRAVHAYGVRRLVAESIAFMYEPGMGSAHESDPIWLDGPRALAQTFAAARELEEAVCATPGVEALVLRFGSLYGPGTWYAPDADIARRLCRRRLPVIGSGAGWISFLHVDDAAEATALAATSPLPESNVMNVVDDEPVTHDDFLRAWAKSQGWPSPARIPTWMARPLGGASAVAVMTRQRAASSERARRQLGWVPQIRSWRTGFDVGPAADHP